MLLRSVQVVNNNNINDATIKAIAGMKTIQPLDEKNSAATEKGIEASAKIKDSVRLMDPCPFSSLNIILPPLSNCYPSQINTTC